MLQCFFLLGNWISLWYTTLSYWPTGYLKGTRSFPIWPLAISMVHYYLLLSYWLSIWYTSLSYSPTDYPYDTLQIYWTNGYFILVIFDISVFETTAIIQICKFTVFSSGSFCQIYRVTDEAFIAETMVWPNFFLMNVFFALKRSKLFIIISMVHYSLLLAHWLSLWNTTIFY